MVEGGGVSRLPSLSRVRAWVRGWAYLACTYLFWWSGVVWVGLSNEWLRFRMV